MPLDWQALLYDPIYAVHGIPATLVPSTGLTTGVDLTVLDKTAGAAVAGQGFAVESVHPAAMARMVELTANGLGRPDLDMSLLTLTPPAPLPATTWRIRSHEMKPSPNGENDGEVMLILTQST